MGNHVLATMFTTTSYGTWLPGDVHGYVEKGRVLPSSPPLHRYASEHLAASPVFFSKCEQTLLFQALFAAAAEFGYTLTDVSVESWHLHWILQHGGDPPGVVAGRRKNRMRQRLARGRIWTRKYWHSFLFTRAQRAARSTYIARHAGCRMTLGRIVDRHTEW